MSEDDGLLVNRPVIAVDLDGVLCSFDSFKGIRHFGLPVVGAVTFVRHLYEMGTVIIYTCRCNPELAGVTASDSVVAALEGNVREWLDGAGFSYHQVFTGIAKPLADVYIDDRAVVAGNGRKWDLVFDDVKRILGKRHVCHPLQEDVEFFQDVLPGEVEEFPDDRADAWPELPDQLCTGEVV